MASSEPVPIVRCHLSGPLEGSPSNLRYVPLAEFGLWKHLMETKHGRQVSVESISIWVAEEAARWNSGYQAESLEPVLRVQFDVAGPEGVPVPVARYFPAETYPLAQEALLRHFEGPLRPDRLIATPGYFVPSANAETELLQALTQGV
jgi:hypothetical protein